MRRVRRSLATPLLAAAALAATGCDFVEDRFKTCEDAFVDLVNSPQSRRPIDIVPEDENASSETFLVPGQSRRIGYCLSKGDRKGFRAIDQQEVLDRAICVASRSNYEGSPAEVRWGPAGLTCSGW